MPLEISFTKAQMKALIERPGANAVVFKPRFNPQGYVQNIEAFPGKHNKKTNEISTECVGPVAATGVAGRATRSKFAKIWNGVEVLSNALPCNGATGQSNANLEDFSYGEVDEQVRAIRNGDPALQDGDGAFLLYELVVFTKEQVLQVFKEKDTLNLPASGRVDRSLKFVLRHMAIDMGRVIEVGSNRGRKCISLYALGLSGTLKHLYIPGDLISLQIGQPCPPDWWFNRDYVVFGG